MYGLTGKKIPKTLQKVLSEFKDWNQKKHAEDYILYPENCLSQLSLDEVALSQGELYTVLTSNKLKEGKGVLLPLSKEPKATKLLIKLLKIDRKLRLKVKDYLGYGGSMKLVAKRCFPNAMQVIDRFHIKNSQKPFRRLE